jgi:hypothetical protein
MRANILILFNWQILQKSAWDMLEKIQDWNTPPVSLFYLSEKSTKFLIFICGGEKKNELNWSNKQIMTWLYSLGYECGTHTFMSLTLFCRAKRIHNKHDSASNHNCGHDSLFYEPYFNLVVNIHTCIYLLFLWKLYIHQSLSKLG